MPARVRQVCAYAGLNENWAGMQAKRCLPSLRSSRRFGSSCSRRSHQVSVDRVLYFLSWRYPDY